MSSETKNHDLKAHCNTCNGERNHQVLFVESQPWEGESGMTGGNKYQMIKCKGCDGVKLRHASWFSEEIDERGLPVVVERYYPPAIFRPEPQWLMDLWFDLGVDDVGIYELLREIYISLQNDSPRLAAMGTRALLEQIMISKVGDQGTFGKNLDRFAEQGYVSKMQMNRLRTILDAGHAAIHRGFKPSEQDLVTLVDFAESLIQHIYLHEGKVDALKKRIPARKTLDNT